MRERSDSSSSESLGDFPARSGPEKAEEPPRKIGVQRADAQRFAHIGSWRSWGVFCAAFLVMAGTGIIINVLSRRADEDRRVQGSLVELRGNAHELETLEWKTIFRGKLDGELSEQLKKIRSAMDAGIGKLRPLELSLPQIREIAAKYETCSKLINEEFRLLADGKIKEAGELDAAKADPAFDELYQTLSDTGSAFDKHASRTLALVRSGTFLVLVAAVGFIATLFWHYHQRRRAAEVFAAEQRGFNLLRAITEGTSDAIFAKDREGRYLMINTVGARLVDKTPEEVVGLDDTRLFSEETRTRIIERDRALMRTGETRTDEEVTTTFGGLSRIFLTTKGALRDPGGAIIGLFGVSRDITERKQAEEALAAQVLRYKTLMETSTDSIYVLDEKGDLQEANAAFLRGRGYTAEEVKGLNVADWDAQWSREQLEQGLRMLVGESAVLETRHRCKDGSLFDVEVCGTSVLIGGEKLLFCVARDITERKNEERALRESEERFRELAENIHEVFWVWSAATGDPRLLYVSPAYATVWGRSCESLYGSPQSWKEALHPDDKKWVLAEVAHPDFEKVNDLSYRIVRPDQSIRWIRDRIFPVRDRSGVVVRFAGIAQDITESKTIAKALESAEEQYRSIFNNALDGIFRTSSDGKLLVTNPAGARIFGFASPEESIEARSDVAQQGYVDPRRREELKRLLQEHGAVKGFEFEAYRKDGSRVWVSENTRAVRSPSGEILYFEGFFEDVTERKRAEEALRESEERFRTIFEQAPLGISEGEIATERFISANQRYTDILGYTIDELRKLTFRDYTHPDDLQKDLVEFQKLAAGQLRTYAMEKRYIRKDGAIIWVNLTVTGLADPGEKPLHCIAVIEEITDRVQAEERLRESEQQMRLFMEATADCLWRTDLITGRTVRSVGFNRVFGYAMEELDSSITWWEERLHPDDRKKVVSTFQDKIASGGNACSYEYRFRRKDGTLAVIHDRAYIVRDAKGKPLSALGAMTDITERRRAAEKLEKANGQLRVLSRQLFHIQEEERRHLARELHDEIGQTLTAAKINLKIIAPEVPANVSGRLDDSVQLLDRLLRQVRELSLDLRPPLLDELGLVPTLRWLVDHQAQRAGLRVTFTANVDGLEIDPDVQTACFRVAQEAITNVIRHSGAKNVAVELRREAERLTLSVRDDGAGFDPAVIQHKTARDFTLGLVSMKERALLVRGGFEVRSAPGEGAEIRAWFPLVPGDHVSTETA